MALTALALMSLFVGIRLSFHEGDSSVFMLAGELVVDPHEAPSNIHIYRKAYGYDGERYYRLARNPFTHVRKEFGVDFTRPAYWQQRIGYPFLAWIVAGFGQEGLTPQALIVTNLLANAVLAGLAARMALDHRRSAWWGLIPALWGGYVVAIAQDLTEVVCGAFLVGGLLALQRRRWGWAVACLVGAALTRESSLIFSVALLFVTVSPVIRRMASADRTPGVPAPKRPPLWVPVAPLAIYLAWRLWIRSLWTGVIPPGQQESDALLGPPFWELGAYIRRMIGDPGAIDLVNVAELVLTFIVLVLLLRIAAQRDSGLPHERLAFAATVLLFICLPVWSRGQAYLRWTCEPVLFGWVIALAAPTKRLRVLAVVVGLLFLVTTGEHLRFPGMGNAVDRNAVASAATAGRP